LAELYYVFLKEFGKKKATLFINKLKFDFIELTPQIALRRPDFRWVNKKKRLLVDCIGYAAAASKTWNLLNN
jgi:hypothetical protein